jgi:DNA-binding IclR family transcriptional regulator
MNTLKERKLRVLSILSENLKNPQPQVVGIEKIAADMGLSLGETRQLLLRMDEAGEIKSDMEGQYSLITPAGLGWLTSVQAGARN